MFILLGGYLCVHRCVRISLCLSCCKDIYVFILLCANPAVRISLCISGCEDVFVFILLYEQLCVYHLISFDLYL